MSIFEGMSTFDLRLCFDGPRLMRYVSFRAGPQENQPSTLTKMLFHIKAVMRWCMSESNITTEKAAAEFYSGVENLIKQVKALTPPTPVVKVEELAEDGQWVDWLELCASVNEYATAVLSNVRDYRAELRNDVRTQRARAKSDAIALAKRLNTAVFGMIFAGGINIGTPRPFLMKSLVLKGANFFGAPAHLEDEEGTDCTVCTRSTCQGNVLLKESSGDFVLRITHHKMCNKIKKVIPPITIRKSTDELAWAVMAEVFEWGHAAYVESFGDMSPSDRLRLFRKPESGAVMSIPDPQDNTPSMMIPRLVAELMGTSGTELHVTANTLRRMYITWSNPRLSSAAQEGAAIAMGTSVTMFNTVYDMNRRMTLVDQGRASTRQQIIQSRAATNPTITTITNENHEVRSPSRLLL